MSYLDCCEKYLHEYKEKAKELIPNVIRLNEESESRFEVNTLDLSACFIT